MKRILTFIGSGGHGDNVSRWRDLEFHHTRIDYDKIITHLGSDENLKVNPLAFDSAVNSLTQGRFDAVFCETPEAMLFRFVATQRGCAQLPYVVLGCDVTYRLERLNRWLNRVYQIDFMEEFLKHPLNSWTYTTKAQRDYYVNAGIPADRLFYVPSSIRFVEMMFPALKRLCKPGAGLSPKKTEFSGHVVAPGNNNRDFDTLAKAVKGTDIRCVVIRDKKRYGGIQSGDNIVLRNTLPLKEYITAIRDCLFVAIPLETGNEIFNGGQLTATYAARFGKACVATRCDAIEECVTDGVNGILVDPGDADAMQQAMLRLAADPDLRRTMGEKGIEIEKQMSAQAEKTWHKLFTAAHEITKSPTA